MESSSSSKKDKKLRTVPVAYDEEAARKFEATREVVIKLEVEGADDFIPPAPPPPPPSASSYSFPPSTSSSSAPATARDKQGSLLDMVAQESLDSKPRIPSLEPPSSTEPHEADSSTPSLPGPSFDAMDTEDKKPTISSSPDLESIAFQLAQLREQARVQSLSILKLTSENKTQAAQIARLSTETRFQDEIIGKLSRKVIPKGHWVQGVQGEGPKGKIASSTSTPKTWEWSLERYADPPPVARTRPYASLPDLSTSLIQLVFSYLGTNELAVISRVSFRLLEVASPMLYKEIIVSFAKARKLFCLRDAAARANHRLLPYLDLSQIRSLGVRSPSDQLGPLNQLSTSLARYIAPTSFLNPLPSLRPVPIQRLVVYLSSNRGAGELDPILRLVNPSFATFRGAKVGEARGSLSVSPSGKPTPTFQTRWDRLQTVTFSGRSILLADVDPSVMPSFLLEDCFKRVKKAEGEVDGERGRLRFKISSSANAPYVVLPESCRTIQLALKAEEGKGKEGARLMVEWEEGGVGKVG